jgi:replicative DNA helicase
VPDASLIPAADVFVKWRDDIFSGKPPVLWSAGAGELGRIEIGPGIVALLGGAPGAGKTAFAMQLMVDALRQTPDLRGLVCNVEMSPAVLLDRQLARVSGVDLTTIRHRRLGGEHADRIDRGMSSLEPLVERLCFVRSPFDLAHVARAADAFGARLLLLDYIQRILPPEDLADNRRSVNATMGYLRQFADAGAGVLVVSALGRTRDSKGRSTYASEGLNLASFRESSELEFGADDAFILTTTDSQDDAVTLRHLKSRHGEARDVELTFYRRLQRFTPAGIALGGHPSPGKVRSELAALWAKTAPAGNDAQEDNDE